MTQLELEMSEVHTDHEASELEVYRRRVLVLSKEIDFLKQQIAEENKAKYEAYKKIAELTTSAVPRL